jgi:hypothetical protein
MLNGPIKAFHPVEEDGLRSSHAESSQVIVMAVKRQKWPVFDLVLEYSKEAEV